MTKNNFFLVATIMIFFSASCDRCNKYKVPDKTLNLAANIDTSIRKAPKVDSILNVDSSSREEICTTKRLKWAPGDNESLLLDPQTGVIYPGSIIDAESVKDGRFLEVIGNRYPIVISISVPSFGRIADTISSPTLSTVRQSVSKILKSQMEGQQPAQISATCYEALSQEQLELSLKATYSGNFGRVAAGFNFSDTKIKTRFLVDVTQIYYSIDVNSISKDSFFSKAPETKLNFSPAYVSSVKYGRRILLSIESDKNYQNKKADLEVEINGLVNSGSLDAHSTVSKLMEEKSIKILAIGGSSGTAFEIMANKDQLFALLKKDANWSFNSQALPLSYTLKNAADNSIFNLVQNGEYTARFCELRPKSIYTIPRFEIGEKYPQRIIAGDKDFQGHGPDVLLKISLSFEGNSVYADVYCDWKEDQNDWTEGDYHEKILIKTLPPEYKILDIISKKDFEYKYHDENEQPDGKSFTNDTEFVESVSIMGDVQGDDLVIGGARILGIVFYPILLDVRK
ncbi:MAG: thiol-activated cytolysin family protein [Chitinophagaceae bacterium]|nr:thiol-activated cytolysin family protein [Chitinophagaceae bacterium]